MARRLAEARGRPRSSSTPTRHPQTIAVRRRPGPSRSASSSSSATSTDLDPTAVLRRAPAATRARAGVRPRPVPDHRRRPRRAAAWWSVATDLLGLHAARRPRASSAPTSCVGSSQRFGVPLGFGGPHAGFLATRDGLRALDARPARRRVASTPTAAPPTASPCRPASSTSAARRRRPTSAPPRCCWPTSPRMYAVYHGPDGLRRIAERVHRLAAIAWPRPARRRRRRSSTTPASTRSRCACPARRRAWWPRAARRAASTCASSTPTRSASRFDETTDDRRRRARSLRRVRGRRVAERRRRRPTASRPACGAPTEFLTHPVFHRHHTETEMLRYLRRLADRDLALDRSMIPLGSCTMKLNATTEMMPITWPEFGAHPPVRPARRRPRATAS